jgi:hypothetical protein
MISAGQMTRRVFVVGKLWRYCVVQDVSSITNRRLQSDYRVLMFRGSRSELSVP